jgi:CRISPR-associated protein Cas2
MRIDIAEYNGTVINDYTRYKVGFTDLIVDPSEEVYKNMLYLVAYDISNPSRLRKIAKTCEDFGIRVEYSVFECDLCHEDFGQLWTLLRNIIDEEEDCILAYHICGSCVSRIESMGAVTRPGKILFYMP